MYCFSGICLIWKKRKAGGLFLNFLPWLFLPPKESNQRKAPAVPPPAKMAACRV
jgi:hypothetical protein